MPIFVFSGTRIIRLVPFLYFLSFLVTQSTFSGAQLLYSCTSAPASDEFTKNRIRLFNQLLHDDTVSSIYNVTSEGEDPNRVYGLYLCNPEVTSQTCYKCVVQAIDTINKQCNGTKEAIIWYDDCRVSYSNISLFSPTLTTAPTFYMWNPQNITEPADKFNNVLSESLHNTSANAISSISKYAARTEDISSENSLYTVAQCIPNLSQTDCDSCLHIAVGGIPDCCLGKKGGRIFMPSCSVRFELYDRAAVPNSSNNEGEFLHKLQLLPMSSS